MTRLLTALPVFNEANHIDEVLSNVRQYCSDILVVDDGSSDGTSEILASQTDLHIVTHEKNMGYGAALRSAFLFAIEQNYDVLVTIDCDGQHEPRLIPEIAAAIFANKEEPVDIVSGSRYLKRFEGDSIPPEERRQINVTITKMLNERLNLNLTDAFCGFKAYRVAALPVFDVTESGYAMPLQHWVQAVNAGLRIVEFPVPLVYLEEERSFGGSLDDGRKRLEYYREVFEREIRKTSLECAATSSCDENSTGC
ncbi:MAG: glycosyltransferase family 2 protein [Planctomycetaceae bacterium]